MHLTTEKSQMILNNEIINIILWETNADGIDFV